MLEFVLLNKWCPKPQPESSRELTTPSAGRDTSNYLDFEEYFRGARHAQEGRQSEISSLYQHLAQTATRTLDNWLDIGCGRGIALDVAKSNGVTHTYGIEQSYQLAVEAHHKQHTIFFGSALDVLDDIVTSQLRFDVISVLHLIEHMQPSEADVLISKCRECLSDGGTIIIETPNVSDPRVSLHSFYRDPTHVRPYPKELLEYLLASAGFLDVYSYNFERFHPESRSHNLRSSDERYRELKRQLSSLKRLALQNEDGSEKKIWEVFESIRLLMEETSEIWTLLEFVRSGKNTAAFGTKYVD